MDGFGKAHGTRDKVQGRSKIQDAKAKKDPNAKTRDRITKNELPVSDILFFKKQQERYTVQGRTTIYG